ncbi:unnamed protein product [Adineta ricciae]|uniref:Uncharacterized protein n=1 Tax=Adineta ricciae TaxID=249248 RepID=A0A815WGA2_ADIRI|nr:unnamed protein product [Adineta ricciae]CAF1650890.1 unnamed protein product [Adineta ricciae]
MGHIISLFITINCRWESTMAAVLMTTSLFIFGEVSVGYEHLPIFRIILAILFGFFTQVLACVLNDITDIKIDKINHPQRPLASGKIDIREAWLVVVICLIFALACGLTLASSNLSYVSLITHLCCSILYSFPGIRLSRNWITGPLTLITAFSSHVLFTLSCTSLYHSVLYGQQLVFLIVSTTAMHHILINPMKDVGDLKGDAIGGATSLAMWIPLWATNCIVVTGYILPWILLYIRADSFAPSIDQVIGIVASLKVLAITFCVAGLVMSYYLLFDPVPLIYYRYSTITRLLPLYLFHVGQPIALSLVRLYNSHTGATFLK